MLVEKYTKALLQVLTKEEAAEIYGNQSIVVSIDVKKTLFGKKKIYTHCGLRKHNVDIIDYVKDVEQMGAGEIFLNSIDKDGTMTGYDISLIKDVADSIEIPVVACGGAGNIDDFKNAVQNGNASAVAAGSMFVFNGPHKAVLISYPDYSLLEKIMKE